MEDRLSKIKHIKTFMPKEVSSMLYNFALSVDSEFTEFGNTKKEFKAFHSGIAKSDVSEEFLILNEYQKKVYDFVLENYPGPFVDYVSNLNHIARFEVGASMHEHFDVTKTNDIACLIYINDNYSGGEIYFPELDIIIKPEAGDLVCFPDTPDFVHGVKTVTGTNRYTLPRWFTRIV
jgi:hypothetical protein